VDSFTERHMTPKQLPDSIPKTELSFADPRQNLIHDYLKRLVGEGAASFYKDACRLMAVTPAFETTTHIVGHLMREIESSLRAVLEGITEPVPTGGDKHKKQIEIILNALGIPDNDPIAIAWLNLPGEAGLHGLAHRDNLDAARPLDDTFRKKWDTINSILFAVLGKFETRYTKVFETLSELAHKRTPNKEDIKKFKSNIPNNRVAHEHFFNSISSSAWLPVLEESGFFKSPPSPEQDMEERGARHPTWPVLIYLSKIAESAPDSVARVLSEIPNSENGSVNAALIDIATRLPREKRLTLLSHVKRWMGSGGQFLSTGKSVSFIESLGKDNEIASALDLSHEFLKFTTEISHGHERAFKRIPTRDVQTVMDQWRYSQFLEKSFPPIAIQDPLNALSLLCEALAKYYDLAQINGSPEYPQNDYSHINRPSIAAREHPHSDDVNDSLIDAILSISANAIEKNPDFLSHIIPMLRKEKWPVFERMALYLLNKYPNINVDLTIVSLKNTDYFDNSNFEHEYALLVESSFNLLSREQKELIFAFIEKAESCKEEFSKYASPDEDMGWFVKKWQRNKLSMFDSYLDGDIKEHYDHLVATFGPADNPKVREHTGLFIGPVSDVGAEAISGMSSEEVISLLNTWEPKKSNHGFGPSKEGLGRELSTAVKNEPIRFSTFAMSFVDVDPTYVRNYIQTFSEVIRNPVAIEWPPIADLCLWVVHQPCKIAGRMVDDTFDEDLDWSWTRKAVISLLVSGLNNNQIPFNLNDKIWEIIEILSEDPNPTPEEELAREGALAEDAYFLTINTVRGQAISAVVEYGLWYTREIKKMPKEKRPRLKGFALLPNVQKVLEKHLNDPSVAVHAVYGRYLPWILYLGRNWTIANLNRIFPTSAFGTPLYDAAWKTYVCYVQVYDDTFDILHNQYSEAVKEIEINTPVKKKSHSHDKDMRLAEHLMVMYWRGKSDTTNSNSLYASFWETTNEDVRAHALDFIGRSLHAFVEPLENKEANLLKKLWEMRIATAEASLDKGPYEKEMETFSWWFASGKFDEDWSTQQFLRSLNLSQNVKADHFVIKRLVSMVEKKPTETIHVLEKVLQYDKKQWLLLGNENELRHIFTKALECPEISAQNAARDLINRLAAWGYPNYSNMLLPSLSV